MLDTECLLDRNGNPDLSGMLVKDSVFSGFHKKEFFEDPALRNKHPVSFCFLLKKGYSKFCSVC